MDSSVPPGLSTEPNSPATLQRQRTHSHSQSQILGHKGSDSIEIKKEEVATRLNERDTWDRRTTSFEDPKYNDQARGGGRPDPRYSDNNRGRFYDRDRDTHRDREANWDRDRDYNRDRAGPVGRMAGRDLDRDRRPDERDRYDTRRPAGGEQRHEPTRRYDNRPSTSGPPESPTTAARPDDSRDRERPGPPADTRSTRPVGEERSLGPLRPLEDRDRRPLPPPEDRRPPNDDRRSVVNDRRPPPPSERDRERPGRPIDDRPPPSHNDRRPLPPDNHRRSPVPGSGYNADRQARPLPTDDYRPPRVASPADRSRPVDPSSRAPPPAVDDRRAQAPGSSLARPRPTSTTITPSDVRPPIPDRPPVDRTTRSHVPLEDRISRPAPSLQDRLSGVNEQTPSSRPEARLPVTEPRPPVGSGPEPSLRPADARPPPPSKDTAAESARPANPPPGTEDRGRPTDRFPPHLAPASQTDRDRTRSGTAVPFAGNRAPSVARDDNRSTTKRPLTVSPSRRYNDAPPPPRSGFANRPPVGEYERERRPDNAGMDVDPSSRYSGDRPPPAVYRRSSPAPFPERNWPPSSGPETYPADARRPATDNYPHSEWREGDTRYPADDYDRRAWDRDRERDRDYERDARVSERDTLPPPISSGPTSTWDRDRDRRPYPPSSVDSAAPPARPYDQRPLSARLTDGYPTADERHPDRDRDVDRDNRSAYPRDYDRRYPPASVDPPATYNRVRPRSPSPAGSARAPPVKRLRDESYPAYYSPTPSNTMDVTSDYPPHGRTRTPQPSSYYNDRPGYGASSAAAAPPRDRDYPDARETYPGYERRPVDSRPLPPNRRTPPEYSRPYDRDDRRYGARP